MNLRLFGALGAAVALVALGIAGCALGTYRVPGIPPGAQTRLVVLFTGDARGFLRPCG